MPTTKSKHSSEDFNRAVIAGAVRYSVHLFLGRGQYDRFEDAASEAEARDIGAKMQAAHPTVLQKPMIYAVDALGRSALLPDSAQSAKETNTMIKTSPAKKAAAKNAPAKKTTARRAAIAKPAAAPATGKRAEILAAAERGVLPTPPDFTAETHKPYRKKLEEIVALVKAGDVKALKAYAINPVSSSPKALDKYRNLALIALKAKAAA